MINILDRMGKLVMAIVFWAIAISILVLGVFLTQDKRQVSKGYSPVAVNLFKYVDDFQVKNKRMPEREEVQLWYKTNQYSQYMDDYIDYHDSDYPRDLVRLAGDPPSNGVYLTSWNGDNTVYYASWYYHGKVGLITDQDYYWGDSKLAQILIFVVLFFIPFYASYFFYNLAFEKPLKKFKNSD